MARRERLLVLKNRDGGKRDKRVNGSGSMMFFVNLIFVRMKCTKLKWWALPNSKGREISVSPQKDFWLRKLLVLITEK